MYGEQIINNTIACKNLKSIPTTIAVEQAPIICLCYFNKIATPSINFIVLTLM